MRVAVGGQHLQHATVLSQDGDVKSTAAEVKHQDVALGLVRGPAGGAQGSGSVQRGFRNAGEWDWLRAKPDQVKDEELRQAAVRCTLSVSHTTHTLLSWPLLLALSLRAVPLYLVL